jgi:hypothetical protein
MNVGASASRHLHFTFRAARRTDKLEKGGSAAMRVTGKLEYYGRPGLGTFPLARTFFRYTNAAGLPKYALTDANGNIDIDATVNSAGIVELVVLAHNPVVRVLEFTANPLTIATERGGTPYSVRIGLTPGATVQVDTNLNPSVHFLVAAGIKERYDEGSGNFRLGTTNSQSATPPTPKTTNRSTC